MSRQDILKVQTLELKVPIHCEGCLKKVKKIVSKIDGVYQSSVDAALGKVTVTGLMDPETVITKIKKSGKPVRVWGEQPGVPLEVQLENLKLGSGGKGKDQQQPKNDVSKGHPKEDGGKGPLQQAKDAGAGGAKEAKMVAPPPHPLPTPQDFVLLPTLMTRGAGKMPLPMPFPAGAAAKDPRTVTFDLHAGDEVRNDDESSGFDDDDYDVDFEDDGLDDDMFDDDDDYDQPAKMMRPLAIPPAAGGVGLGNGVTNGAGGKKGGGSGAQQPPKNGKGAPGGGNQPRQGKKGGVPAGAGLGAPPMMMRPPHMTGVGGGAGFPRMGPIGGMPMGHPSMHQGGRGGDPTHGKPAGGMPMGGLPHMVGAGMQVGGAHVKPAGGMPMGGHPHMGGTGMQPGGAAHGMPAGGMPTPGFFPGGSMSMPAGQEMLAMSKLPPEQQHRMAAGVMAQQQQQQQMLLNGHGHHHGHHVHWRPPMPQYPPPPPYYYAIPPQRHPHDNMFSDENPNACSVM